MHRILKFAVVAALAAVFAPSALADDVIPFPSAHAGDVFVIAQTVDANGAIGNYYKPGSTITFRAYAVDGKTHDVVTPALARYFYVKIPNQPNVKLQYKGRLTSGAYTWSGSWTVPADYALGPVSFKVLVQTKKTHHRGAFVQVPIQTALLTVTNNPPQPFGPGPATSPAPAASKVDIALYVDSVNGTAPAGTTPRPIGCTQTNVYKRGERVVVRAWGFDLGAGAVLTMDNVADAHFSVAGQPDVVLNWGSHGPTGNKVWFWANGWVIPASYPIGDTTIHVTYKLTNGKVGTFDHTITVVP